MYSTDIYRYSLSLLKDTEDAKDAVHETFIRYSENESQFRGESSQKTWLLVIARNYCYSKMKKADRANVRIDDNDPIVYNPEYDVGLTLKAAINNLYHEQSELLFLKVYYNYSYVEIAEITNQTVENVAIKLYRIRQKLKKILETQI